MEFKGGTYCSQVVSKDVKESLQFWLSTIREQKSEIKYLGEKIWEEIANVIKDEDYQPVMLQGLKNIWCMHIPTRKGSININIVQTDVSQFN